MQKAKKVWPIHKKKKKNNKHCPSAQILNLLDFKSAIINIFIN